MDKGLIEMDIDEEERKVMSYLTYLKYIYQTYLTFSTERTRKYLQSIIYPIQFYKIAQTSRLPSFLIYVTLSFAILSSFESIYTGLIERDSC